MVSLLPENSLTTALPKSFSAFVFMGHIANVWKEWLTDICMAQTIEGKEIFLPETDISSENIEKIMNDKRGGKREGADSKRKTGYSTTTIRIPVCIKEHI